MNGWLKVCFLTSILAVALTPLPSRASDSLKAGFNNPPDSAKPHTWWHWMNGNVTREGITADLQAMKTAGIGGAQMFHVGERIPAGPVRYMSPQWLEMVGYSIKEAERLGLELCIHNCAGWSSSAGPWITPEVAMQVIAWSEKKVTGPLSFRDVLPKPKPLQIYKPVDYYRDVAALAYPVPAAGDHPLPPKQILAKTGVTRQNMPFPEITTGSQTAISLNEVVVLTEKMDADGRLTWEVPPGDWMILRFGYMPTGAENRATPEEGRGLEVDKFSRDALDVHWNAMIAKVIEVAGPHTGTVLNNALIDSYEVGNQNWTPKFREEFVKRRGYDLLHYLPVIAGRTVGSAEESERFLWDFRRTIGDLFADNYFGYFRDLCHKHGMQFSTEGYGNGGFDNLQVSGLADIPMGEFWAGGAHYIKSSKLASSAAHSNARKLVGAEAFTASLDGGRYKLDPYSLKALGDLAFTYGINRYIFHRYAHQPWLNLEPGMTMGKWGMHLERTTTWWKEAAAWFKYIARAQYLLQEGRFVADVLYYYNEGAPNDLPEREKLKPSMPEGYDYDGCDATTLQRLSVKDGRLVLPDGMSYRVMVLPDRTFMTPAVAEKVRELVRAGATVIGPKPLKSPSLSGYPQCDDAVSKIGDEVWGAVDGERIMQNQFGDGRVYSGVPLQQVLEYQRVPTDFWFSRRDTPVKLAWIHRSIGDADVYFVSNQLYSVAEADCNFRVTEKVPELWNAENGETHHAPVFRQSKNWTEIPLRLEPAESVFVVFRKGESAPPNHITYFNAPATSSTIPQVKISHASYEAVDGSKQIDVTRQVAEMVAEGMYEIPAVADIYGDPKPKSPKRLLVEYELDGRLLTKTVGDRDTLYLDDIAYNPTPLQYEVRTTTEGATLLPWAPGDYGYNTASGSYELVHVQEAPLVTDLSLNWSVNFDGKGASKTVKFERLTSWTAAEDPEIKYYSGSAVYTRSFEVSAEMLKQGRVTFLDLGRVKNFATVHLNGHDLGTLWKSPFRVEVSSVLKPGSNQLELRLTNLWPNRLIGDEQLPTDANWKDGGLLEWPQWLVEGKPRPSGRLAFSTWKYFDKDSPLLESGLIGPAFLRTVTPVTLKLQ